MTGLETYRAIEKRRGLWIRRNVECKECGACCARSWTIDVFFQDLTRMSTQTTIKHTDEGLTGTEMRLVRIGRKTRCSALKGTVGKNCKCTIYDERPDTCREFKKGSTQCIGSRMTHGLQVEKR